MTYLLGVLAAIAYGTNWVLQQHEAAQAPECLELHPVRLLHRLAHRPLWLVGLAMLVIGSALQEAAIATGSLSISESLLIFDLVWALLLARLIWRVGVRRSQWTGALAVCAGLIVLLLIGQPTRGVGTGVPLRWFVLLAAVGAVTVLGCGYAWRRPGVSRAVVCSCLAGGLFGVSDALSKAAFNAGAHGWAHLAVVWQAYACVAAAAVGVALCQVAYNAARLAISLPGLAIGEPLAGLVAGLVVLHVHFRVGVLPLAAEAAAAAVMLAGALHSARAHGLHRPGVTRPAGAPAAVDAQRAVPPLATPRPAGSGSPAASG